MKRNLVSLLTFGALAASPAVAQEQEAEEWVCDTSKSRVETIVQADTTYNVHDACGDGTVELVDIHGGGAKYVLVRSTPFVPQGEDAQPVPLPQDAVDINRRIDEIQELYHAVLRARGEMPPH